MRVFAAWLSSWSSLWRTPDLPDRVHIVFSPRLRASLGRCSPRTGSIRLNPGLLEADPSILREVVCHEAAHVAAWLLHGRRARPHGRKWKDMMRAAGYEPRARWPHHALLVPKRHVASWFDATPTSGARGRPV